MKMNSHDEKELPPQLFVSEEGSFTSTGIAPMRGHGKILRTSPEEMKAKKERARKAIEVPIVLATVQHSASRFFVSLLQDHYGPPWPIHERGAPFYFDHCRDSMMDSILARVAEGAVLITTTRDWDECWESWERRGVNTRAEFNEQIENWYNYIYPMASVVVSAFSDDRDLLLGDLSNLIRIPLTTDWKKVG